MPKQQYCELLRTTNAEQREVVLEAIHRLHGCGDELLRLYKSSSPDQQDVAKHKH